MKLDRIPFCSDIDQVAFTIFGCEIGLAQVIIGSLALITGATIIFSLATRRSSRRYRSGVE